MLPTPPPTPLTPDTVSIQETPESLLLSQLDEGLASPRFSSLGDWTQEVLDREYGGWPLYRPTPTLGRRTSIHQLTTNSDNWRRGIRQDMNTGSSSFISARRLLWPESEETSTLVPDTTNLPDRTQLGTMFVRRLQEYQDRLNWEIAQQEETVQTTGTPSGDQQLEETLNQ